MKAMSNEQGFYPNASHSYGLKVWISATFVAQAPKSNTPAQVLRTTTGKSINKAQGSKISEFLQCNELLTKHRQSQMLSACHIFEEKCVHWNVSKKDLR